MVKHPGVRPNQVLIMHFDNPEGMFWRFDRIDRNDVNGAFGEHTQCGSNKKGGMN